MKATIDVPDELYRRVEAKSTREGRAVGEVTVALYQSYVELEEVPTAGAQEAVAGSPQFNGRTIPSWFGVLGKTAASRRHHDMEAIRESIGRGIARDRGL